MSNLKIVILFVGPPGCGKGSTGEKICKKYNLIHISTGDMLRAECSSGTEFGKRIKETIDAGNLVSDDIMLKLIAAFIQRHVDINGYLFDGFPRTEIQAHGLADILKDHNLNVNKVFKFDVMKDMLIERAVGRLIHPASGRVYHAKNYPPKIANCDDETGEPLVHRADDNEEVILRRIETYEKTTKPLLNYYHSLQLVCEINANEELTAVTDSIQVELEKILI